jgi:hypothetical protein
VVASPVSASVVAVLLLGSVVLVSESGPVASLPVVVPLAEVPWLSLSLSSVSPELPPSVPLLLPAVVMLLSPELDPKGVMVSVLVHPPRRTSPRTTRLDEIELLTALHSTEQMAPPTNRV